MIVGNESVLRREIQDEPFAIQGEDGKLIEGRLQDVLRARGLGKEGECYRSEIVSTTGKSIRRLVGSTPHVVIFDGATGFPRWGAMWSNAHWVVILDRAEYRFVEAVSELNRIYLTRLEDQPIPAMPSAPGEIECAAFLAKRG
jgi:hypothetical protein